MEQISKCKSGAQELTKYGAHELERVENFCQDLNMVKSCTIVLCFDVCMCLCFNFCFRKCRVCFLRRWVGAIICGYTESYKRPAYGLNANQKTGGGAFFFQYGIQYGISHPRA